MSDGQRPTRCLVTGASSAIGQATVPALTARGWEVQRLADVPDLPSVCRAATEAATLGPLDVLVDLGTGHLGHAGHFALTGLLLPTLVASGGARVVTVTSLAARLGQVDDLLFTSELGRRARAVGWPVTAVAAHPGLVASDLLRGGAIGPAAWRLVGQSPESAARTIVTAATEPGLAAGSYVVPSGPMELNGAPQLVAMPRQARDPVRAARLWEASERATGVSFGLG